MVSEHGSKFLKTVSALTLITLASKIVGLIRSILTASLYGSSDAGIAFELADRLPTLLFDFALGGVIVAVFIPAFNDFLVREGSEKAYSFAHQYLFLLSVLSLVLITALEISAPFLMRILAPYPSEEILRLSVTLTRLLTPMILFASLSSLFIGIQQSLNSYYLPAAVSLFSGLLVILYLLFFNRRFGVIGLALIMLFSWIFQAAVQIPKLRSLSFPFRLCLPEASTVSSSLRMAGPILIASWGQPLILLISTHFASGLEEGKAVTAFSYANKLYLVIAGLLIFSVTNLLYPRLSQINAARQYSLSSLLLRKMMGWILLTVTPVTLFLFFSAEDTMRFLFGHGQFNEQDVRSSGLILCVLAAAILPFVVTELMTKALYARRHTLVPMLASLAGLVVHVCIIGPLVLLYHEAGLALALVVSFWITALIDGIYGFYALSVRFFRKDVGIFLWFLFLSACSAALLFLAAYFLSDVSLWLTLPLRFAVSVLPFLLGVWILIRKGRLSL